MLCLSVRCKYSVIQFYDTTSCPQSQRFPRIQSLVLLVNSLSLLLHPSYFSLDMDYKIVILLVLTVSCMRWSLMPSLALKSLHYYYYVSSLIVR
jgi:hypothetical protein